MIYIGERERTLNVRVCEHIGYIHTKKYQEPAGEHLKSAGQAKADMKVLVLEKVNSCHSEYRKEQESDHIGKFNTYYRGLNKKP